VACNDACRVVDKYGIGKAKLFDACGYLRHLLI
jgi:hypothetical protein